MQSTDVLILDAGMAGASAAMYSETYGNAAVRAMTTASKPFYFKPPPGFAEHPLVTPRGSLTAGTAADQDHPRTVWQDLRDLVPDVQWWTHRTKSCSVCPCCGPRRRTAACTSQTR